MHVNHLVFAVGPDGLKAEAEKLSDALGAEYKDGGVHPRFGTRTHLIPLADQRYIEVVEVLDHPAADKAVYGQAVRARSEMGGGWLGWVLTVDDLTPIEQRLERHSVPGTRHFPDGRKLEWRQIGVKGLMTDPQLPYFISWDSPSDVLPSALSSDVRLTEIEIGGSPDRVEEWIGEHFSDSLDGVKLTFVSPNGHPGIAAVTFESPTHGTVRI